MSDTGYHWRYNPAKIGNAPPEQLKGRPCLKCRAPFESVWAGERVCPKCKTTKLWRDGVAPTMASWSRQ